MFIYLNEINEKSSSIDYDDERYSMINYNQNLFSPNSIYDEIPNEWSDYYYNY